MNPIKIEELNNYDEYKNKIINSKSYIEAIDILDEYDFKKKEYSNILERDLLTSFIDQDNYYIKIDDLKFIKLLNGIKYRDELNNITNDPAQLSTINRIFNEKKSYNISKNCPFCNLKYYNNEGKKYIICGLNDKPPFTNGCSRDWCFDCGKKLCKSWYLDNLYDLNNRSHDICCKKHAKKNGFNINEYCNCYMYKIEK